MIEMKKFVSNGTILQNKDFSHYMTESEYFRYKQNWWISLNKSGDTGPLRNRSDFNEALSTLNRLHQESGERPPRPMPCWKYQERHPSSSSSSSWWQGVDPGGLHKNSKKVYERGGKQRFMIERRSPLCTVFGYNLRRVAFTIFLCSLFCCKGIV